MMFAILLTLMVPAVAWAAYEHGRAVQACAQDEDGDP